MKFASSVLVLLVATLLVSTTGCPKAPNKDGDQQAKAKEKQEVAKKDDGKKDFKAEGGHEGWWCQEHGVPEEICSLCLSDTEVKKRYKDTGDWCKIHERAKSQCFKCEPALYKKYEDMYVAKFGKKPEKPPKEEFEK
jgi:hypothetical protein